MDLVFRLVLVWSRIRQKCLAKQRRNSSDTSSAGLWPGCHAFLSFVQPVCSVTSSQMTAVDLHHKAPPVFNERLSAADFQTVSIGVGRQ